MILEMCLTGWGSSCVAVFSLTWTLMELLLRAPAWWLASLLRSTCGLQMVKDEKVAPGMDGGMFLTL